MAMTRQQSHSRSGGERTGVRTTDIAADPSQAPPPRREGPGPGPRPHPGSFHADPEQVAERGHGEHAPSEGQPAPRERSRPRHAEIDPARG